jgi:signal transduction histidine kinase
MNRKLRRVPIVAKLLAVYLIPAIATFIAFSLLAHLLASRTLERSLGRRLTGVAASVARAIEDEHEGLTLLQPHDESTRTYRNVRRTLSELAEANGVARVYVFDSDGNSVCDTQGTPIGEPLYSLSRSEAEIKKARAGTPTASVLFRAQDGQLLKSAFAQVADPDRGVPRFTVGVDAAAAMYTDLASLRGTLATAGLAGIFAVVLVSLLAARLLVRPISALEEAAARIGRGDLDQPIERRSRDEIGTVAETLEHMRGQLRSRDERMQMMLAGIAHEVRNPLGGLTLYAGLLREEVPADKPELGDHVKKVERELEHLKRIVNDFLEYARRPRPAMSRIDAAELCDDIRGLVQADADVRKITIACDLLPGAQLSGDVGQLRRALINLVQNAVQASRDGATVTLRVADGDNKDQLAVSVVDQGSGIPAEQLAKIWTPFYTTKQKGTGLGLAFVREIAEDHGGRVEVRSVPNEGTTFTLHLPKHHAGS